jgi:catechol 2,3-dioxygenase-like lactoylglutathione lyase family enzyme
MKLRHVGITVSNLSNSLSFYQDILGFTILKEMDESGEQLDNFSGLRGVKVTTVKLQDSSEGVIELLHYKSHPKSNEANLNQDITFVGCSHFAITVKDLSQVYTKLLKNDVSVLCEPQYSPDGNVMLTFCKDPDGTLIELVEELR